MRLIPSLLLALLAAPAWAADPQTTTTSGGAAAGSSAKEAGAHAAIQAKYDKLCKSCHGPDGKGVAAKAKTLKIDATKLDMTRADAAKLTKDERKKIIAEGKEKMPAYAKKLKAEELDAMVDYVEGLVGGTGGAKPK